MSDPVNRSRRAAKPAPVGSGAKVLPGQHLSLLEAYGDAFSSAVREVYRRCVIYEEDWFVAEKPGVRSELISRGWSQREATSIYTAACAAQDSAVESNKLALARARQDLEVLTEKLEKTKRSKKHRHRCHGLARRRSVLETRVSKLERRLLTGDVRVAFGGRKLVRAGNNPHAHGYPDRAAWRERWDRARGGGFVAFGDAESTCGNYSARVALGEKNTHVVVLRVPGFLRDLTDGAEWAEIPVVGFINNRDLLEAAMQPDLVGLKERTESWEDATDLYELQRGLFEAGFPSVVPKKPAANAPRLKSRSPVTVRFFWREDKDAWYAEATCDRPVSRTHHHWAHVLGADFNPDHIAWCLANHDGNPVRWGRIDIDLSGTAAQNRDRLGMAVAELARIAKAHGAAISVEKLDFTRARAQLRYASRRIKRLLSSFAYNKFFSILASRCAREGIEMVSVNPAWSSVLGQANYAGVHGVSVDQGAACVLARRSLGFRERVRPAVARQLPRSAAGEQTKDLRVLAKTLPKRRSTWEPSGLCTRNAGHSARSTGPPGKDGSSVPAPRSPSGPATARTVGKPVPCANTVAGVRTRAHVAPGKQMLSRLVTGRMANDGQGWK